MDTLDHNTCPGCKQSVSQKINFCSNCGEKLSFVSGRANKSDKYLLAFVIVTVSTTAYWLILDVLSKFIGFEIYDWLYYFSKLVDLTLMAALFLIVASIQKSGLKIAALVLVIVIILIRLYWFISRIILDFSSDFEFFEF